MKGGRCLGDGFVKTQLLKVEQRNIGFDYPNQMILGNEFVQRDWK